MKAESAILKCQGLFWQEWAADSKNDSMSDAVSQTLVFMAGFKWSFRTLKTTGDDVVNPLFDREDGDNTAEK